MAERSSRQFVVALTGASGTRYGRRLVQCLSGAGHAVDLIVSPAAGRVLLEEEGIVIGQPPDPHALLADLGGQGAGPVRSHGAEDYTAPCASGSHLHAGMAIVPCSMATVGALASGAGRHLVHRAADVCLKERRPLVIAPRETPLSAIHLRNLLLLAEAGACILPCMPAFTHHPASVADLVDQLVMRVLDHLDVHLDLVSRWGAP
jgi:flavin prenyltransferase